jgi:2-amino-4-hydroxy-6-hydroxymethyldihydropteridine diphosphokinase
MNLVYLSIGSNLGNRLNYIRKSVLQIAELLGEITAVSSLYETEPMGFTAPEKFLNCCIAVETTKSATQILRITQEIEKDLGRIRFNDSQYHSRTIDIDTVFFNNEIINLPHFQVPHKHFSKRNFVLKPLCDIAHAYIDPKSGKTIQELLINCPDNQKPLLISDSLFD